MLRDYFLTDLDTFINSSEFATTKEIDGTDMLVIWATDLFKDNVADKKQLLDPSGFYFDTVVMEVKASDFGQKPAVGQEVTVDSDFYYVLDVNEWEGLYQITLEVKSS